MIDRREQVCRGDVIFFPTDYVIDAEGEKLLSLACLYGNLAMVKFLCTHGAGLAHIRRADAVAQACTGRNYENLFRTNQRNDDLSQHVAIIDYLFTQGVTIADLRANDYECLREITELPLLEALFRHGITLEDIRATDYNVLHVACIYGNLEMVQFLFTQGLTYAELCGDLYCYPLATAAHYQHIAIIHALILHADNARDVRCNDDIALRTCLQAVAPASILEDIVRQGAYTIEEVAELRNQL